MDFSFSVFISAVVLILEQQGHTESQPVTQSHANRSSAVFSRREKRCSCENLRDKECIYFCHIGIVWVDTPSQVTPYGLGSSQTRLRRDVKRCLCANRSDTKCLMFCSNKDLQHKKEHVSVKRFHLRNFIHYKSRFPSRLRHLKCVNKHIY